MAKPTNDPTWATDATYDYDASANKVEPGSAHRADGFERAERPGAQHFNWLLNTFGQWLVYLDGVVDGTVDTDGVNVTLELGPKSFHPDIDSGGLGLWYSSGVGGGWRTRGNNALLQCDLTPFLPPGCTITAIDADVDPGQGRAGSSRMGLELSRRTIDWATPSDISAGAHTVYDTTSGGAPGTHPREVIALAAGLPYAFDGTEAIKLTIFGGSDSGTNTDVFYKARVVLTTVRAV